MLDIGQISSFADYFVICTAESERQIHAIGDAVDGALSREGIKLCRREAQRIQDGYSSISDRSSSTSSPHLYGNTITSRGSGARHRR